MKSKLLLLFAFIGIAGPAAAAEGILPGYWESTNRLLSPIHTKSVEQRCITPEEVTKFMMGPSNHHYTCTYPLKSFEGGRIKLSGECVSKKGQKVKVAGEGSFTPTTFQLTATVATDILGIPIAAKASTEAHRISDVCPPKPDKKN
ncbi:DUF3617 domain-containing protein [Phenylobacterium sp.]|uniref:DUF3617 domain-containing protein n=1 Tax=Phenylobacterium sp. TaxID=1871053 RepID=UPI0035B04E10